MTDASSEKCDQGHAPFLRCASGIPGANTSACVASKTCVTWSTPDREDAEGLGSRVSSG